MSTVVSRTDEGLELFDIAEERGFLEVEDGVNAEAMEKAGRLKSLTGDKMLKFHLGNARKLP